MGGDGWFVDGFSMGDDGWFAVGVDTAAGDNSDMLVNTVYYYCLLLLLVVLGKPIPRDIACL
jgi:hypothetical protein